MSTWNIKGVSPSARETVKRMAARHDQNAGQWLEQTIRQSIAHQRLERRRTLMKQLLHQIEQQQLLQNEFQNRYDWLSDRLTKLQNQLDAYHQYKDSPAEDHPPIQAPVLSGFFRNDYADRQDNNKNVDPREDVASNNPANDTLESMSSNHKVEHCKEDTVTPGHSETTANMDYHDNHAADNFASEDQEDFFSPPQPFTEMANESQTGHANQTALSESTIATNSLTGTPSNGHTLKKSWILRLIQTLIFILLWLILTGAMVYGLSTGYLQQQLEQYLGHTSAAFEQPHYTNPLAFRSNTPNRHPYRLSFDDRLDRQRPYPQTGQKPRYRCLSCMHSGTQQAIAWHQSIWQ